MRISTLIAKIENYAIAKTPVVQAQAAKAAQAAKVAAQQQRTKLNAAWQAYRKA